MPIFSGAWVPWLPFALPACFPFCWWLCVVLDQYSRRVVGVAVFACQPSAKQAVQFLGRVVAKVGQAPKHLISDQGSQFTSDALGTWCTRRGIRQRFGAIGQHGSIALIERFIRTLKYHLRLWPVVALVRRTFLRDVNATVHWYNTERPHMSLKGATPDEVYFRKRRANQQPRFEPRDAWPRGSPCAAPIVLVKGQWACGSHCPSNPTPNNNIFRSYDSAAWLEFVASICHTERSPCAPTETPTDEPHLWPQKR